MDKKCEDMKDECCMAQQHCCFGGRHNMLRWIVGIAIILGAYWLGVQMGEFRGAYGYGYGMMGQNYWGRGYMMRGFDYPMMYRYGVSLPVSVSATSTY